MDTKEKPNSPPKTVRKKTATVAKSIRPTKKQHDLLAFIQVFIAEHGYSPSYREIRAGLQYNSVATVALHVNNLIKRGHLQKRDRSARSLEVVKSIGQVEAKVTPKQLKTDEEKWLIEKIELYFKEAEELSHVEAVSLDKLQVLIGTLKVLGASAAAQGFSTRLSAIKKKQTDNQYTV